MARETRAATGHSTPRVFPSATEETTAKARPKTKSNTKAKRAPAKGSKPAGISKNKAPIKSAAVEKKKTATTPKTDAAEPTTGKVSKMKKAPQKTSLLTKVVGIVEYAEGVIEGKPGKKGAGTKKIRGTASTKKATPTNSITASTVKK